MLRLVHRFQEKKNQKTELLVCVATSFVGVYLKKSNLAFKRSSWTSMCVGALSHNQDVGPASLKQTVYKHNGVLFDCEEEQSVCHSSGKWKELEITRNPKQNPHSKNACLETLFWELKGDPWEEKEKEDNRGWVGQIKLKYITNACENFVRKPTVLYSGCSLIKPC